ncbi:MAG: PAS domain S-box protein [Candidatus Kapabacteria bacterium]|nr:PAS domain S-box protein [Candidatus Kapabacteria bacterium]
MFKSKYFKIILVILGILFISGSANFIYYEKNRLEDEKYSELKVVSELKINQISRWKKERYADIDVLTNLPFIKKSVKQLMDKTINDENTNELSSLMKTACETSNYENIIILSPDLKKVLSVQPTDISFDSTSILTLKKSISQGQKCLSDFFICQTHGRYELDLISPIESSGQLIALLIMRINPKDYLFQMLQSWPTLSKSSETLIVRRDADSVTFLFSPSKSNDSIKIQRLPLSMIDLPAAQVVMGKRGKFIGIDYQDEKVLSDLNQIPDTNWFLITKIDSREIYNVLYLKSAIYIGGVLIFLLCLYFGMGYVYKSKEKNILQSLLDAEESLRSVLSQIGDGIELIDYKGNLIGVNIAECSMLGYNREEMILKNITEIEPSITLESFRVTFNETIGKSQVSYETVHLHKNGTLIPVEINFSIVNLNGQQYGLSIVRDNSPNNKTGE